MPLTKKVFILILILNLFTILSLYAVLQVFVMTKFEQIEHEEIVRKTRRAESALYERYNPIVVLNRDWAKWDDTYSFISGVNDTFISANLVDETLLGSGLDAVYFYDVRGSLLHTKEINPENKESGDTFNILKSTFTPNSVSAYKQQQFGFLSFNDRLVFISIHPVLRSDGSGPANGYILMAKFIRREDTAKLNEITGQELLLSGRDDLSPIDVDNDVNIVALNSDRTESSMILNDFFGSPTLLLRVFTEREVTKQGAATIMYVLATSVFVSIISLVVSIIFINLVLLRPLKKVIDEVNNIRSIKDFSLRINTSGNAELNELVDNVNRLLDALHVSQNKLKNINESISNQAKALEEKTQEMERINQYMVGREIRMAELKQQIADLKLRLEEKGENGA
ncbi:HAMP domain-containing protein [candidate division WWE3 bacterium]|jgi:sensor domain CHASE-containing protein|uniref:HAMP domain-containing protein n=1 Tax=candidate division WWE3 bacterium TaxID=2053526 RepID=A0A3A4ZFE0_UNCKA|nr:MAG: HAMP domain-containing protein [candidate division WWE3 bacterium]